MDDKTIVDLLNSLEDARKLLGEGLSCTESGWGWAYPKPISKEEADKRLKEGFHNLDRSIEIMAEEYYKQTLKEK